MSKGPCTFKQRDVAAAAKAMRRAGFKVVRVEIDQAGKIVVVTEEHNATPNAPAANKTGKVSWR